MIRAWLTPLIAALLLAASTQPAVHMSGSAFAPADLTITAGQSVDFINDDAMPHTVTSADNSFDSGEIAAGKTWSHTFEKAGTYRYVCAYHDWMHGTIKVESR